jgi:hypothetical protein
VRGRAEVWRLKQKLERVFLLIEQLPELDLETRSHFAQYLCILVSGFLERAVQELAMERCRKSSDRTIQSYVRSQIERFINPTAERLVQLVGMFDRQWEDRARDFIVEERKEAVNSINGLRNAIAHGQDVGGLTYARVNGYYEQVQLVIEFLADLFDPAPSTTKPPSLR